jgi:two-component system, OmpR family, response regulator ChvI
MSSREYDDLLNENMETINRNRSEFEQNNDRSPDNEITFVNYSNDYCVCIIDIINSTDNTSEIVDSKKIRQYYSVFLNTMTSIIKHHNGKVVKNSGDSLLFYFPRTVNQGNYIDFQDVIECGLSMIDAKDRVDLLLNLNGLPLIDYRISATYGRIELAIAGNSQSIDIFGTPVNRCSKINHLAPANEMIIHDDLFQVVNKMSYYKDYEFKEITRQDDTNNHNRDNYDPGSNSNNLNSVYSVHRAKDINKQMEIENKIQKLHAERKRIKKDRNNASFNILIIDDDKDILFTFTSIIKSQGYSAKSFSNPSEALNDFSNSNPYTYDLILMDIRMPGINGIKLYSKFKVINPEIKIIFISALDAISEILSFFPEITDSNVLRKPIEADQLLNKINTEIRN